MRLTNVCIDRAGVGLILQRNLKSTTRCPSHGGSCSAAIAGLNGFLLSSCRPGWNTIFRCRRWRCPVWPRPVFAARLSLVSNLSQDSLDPIREGRHFRSRTHPETPINRSTTTRNYGLLVPNQDRNRSRTFANYIETGADRAAADEVSKHIHQVQNWRLLQT